MPEPVSPEPEAVQPEAVQPEPASSHAVPSPHAELARRALTEITPADTIGEELEPVDEVDGVVSVRFATLLPGYPGWAWTVSVAQVAGEEPSVLEAELLPGDDALVAPPWVPWADRLAEMTAQEAGDDSDDDDSDDEDDSDDDDSDDDDDDSDDDDSDDDDSDEDDDSDDEDDDHSDDEPTTVVHGGDVDGVDIDGLDDQDSDDDDDDDSDDDWDGEDVDPAPARRS